ncbi:MAG: phage tail protein [Oscillospiraceae bacterium]|nr:phage tail protein [Oscillospiraceae bacterium]
MKPVLYEAAETEFVSNGIGRLSDAVSCTVLEERNGQYELEMEYPVSGIHYKELAEDRIILARHDDTSDTQPFRIYKISRPMKGIVTVYARHISYQLSKVVVLPCAANSCAAALQEIKQHSQGDNPFTMWTDRNLEANFKVTVPSAFRSLLGGTSGSILDVYGPGEYEWDRWTVKFHAARGADTGVTIRYGKNLTDIKKTTDLSDLWTGIVPYWSGTDDADEPVVVMLENPVIYSPAASNYAYKLIIPVDLSSGFEQQPTVEQLRAKAEAYVRNNAQSRIPESIDISFVALWQTAEYKNVAPLQRLRLCDTVSVYHTGLGIESTGKIVSVTYNVLLERYDKMTIGEARTHLSDSIKAISETATKELPTTSAMQQAIKKATNLITGGHGGHVILSTNALGQPEEILILDTETVETAVEVLRINKNGIGFSHNGYNGPFETAWTLDGNFVADFITTGSLNASLIDTGVLNASLITTGLLKDKTGNNYWNMDTGEFRLASTVSVSTTDGQSVTVQTLSQYMQGIADDAAEDAVDAYDEELTQQAVFNKLTNDGETQGIYLENGKLYLNATYIKTGTLSANIITAGILKDSKNKNSWNLDTGVLTASNISATGSFTCGDSNGASLEMADGKITGYLNNRQYGQITLATHVDYRYKNGPVQYKDAMVLESTDMFLIVTPYLAVRENWYNSYSYNVGITNTFGQSIVTNLSATGNDYGIGSMSWGSGRFSLTFIHGVCVDWYEVYPT